MAATDAAGAIGGMTGNGAGAGTDGVTTGGPGGDDRGGAGGVTLGGGGGPAGALITIPGTVESGAQPAAPSYQARSVAAREPSLSCAWMVATSKGPNC